MKFMDFFKCSFLKSKKVYYPDEPILKPRIEEEQTNHNTHSNHRPRLKNLTSSDSIIVKTILNSKKFFKFRKNDPSINLKKKISHDKPFFNIPRPPKERPPSYLIKSKTTVDPSLDNYSVYQLSVLAHRVLSEGYFE